MRGGDGHVGRERQRKLQDAVRAHLRERPCHQGRGRRRRFVVGERQPRMKRHERNLDEARQHDRDEHEHLHVPVEAQAIEHAELERPRPGLPERLHAESDDRGEQQDAACHRVQEERDRRTAPALTAVHEDQHACRDQHGLPEYEEQHGVLREERAQQTRLEDEHQHEVQPPRRVRGVPRASQHHREQQSGKQHEVRR